MDFKGSLLNIDKNRYYCRFSLVFLSTDMTPSIISFLSLSVVLYFWHAYLHMLEQGPNFYEQGITAVFNWPVIGQ